MIIKKSALRFIHKAIINKKPTQIFEKLRFNNGQKNCSKIALRKGFSKEINKRTLIFKSVELYNKSKPSMKYLTIKKFKSELKKMTKI